MAAGVSMADLAERLGVSVASVSTLELNDERGTAKTATIERAMVALDMARWDEVLPASELEAIFAKAEDIAGAVAWDMALEGQAIGDETVVKIVRTLVGEWVARLRARPPGDAGPTSIGCEESGPSTRPPVNIPSLGYLSKSPPGGVAKLQARRL